METNMCGSPVRPPPKIGDRSKLRCRPSVPSARPRGRASAARIDPERRRAVTRLAPHPRHHQTLFAAVGLAVGTALALLGEVVWVARRPLPSLAQLDASGLVPGRREAPPLRLVVLGDS